MSGGRVPAAHFLDQLVGTPCRPTRNRGGPGSEPSGEIITKANLVYIVARWLMHGFGLGSRVFLSDSIASPCLRGPIARSRRRWPFRCIIYRVDGDAVTAIAAADRGPSHGTPPFGSFSIDGVGNVAFVKHDSMSNATPSSVRRSRRYACLPWGFGDADSSSSMPRRRTRRR